MPQGDKLIRCYKIDGVEILRFTQDDRDCVDGKGRDNKDRDDRVWAFLFVSF